MTYPDQVGNLVAWRDQLKPQAEFWLTEIGNDVGGPIGRTERVQATKVPRAVMIALAAGVDEVMIYRESGSDPARIPRGSALHPVGRAGMIVRSRRAWERPSKTRMRWPRRVKAIELIELPNFREGLEELEKPLDLWLYSLQNGAELDADGLPGSLDIPEIRWAMGVLNLLAQNDLERELSEGRLKAKRDLQTRKMLRDQWRQRCPEELLSGRCGPRSSER